MTADLDLSPEAVERLAVRVHESKAGRDVRSEAVATLRALPLPDQPKEVS